MYIYIYTHTYLHKYMEALFRCKEEGNLGTPRQEQRVKSLAAELGLRQGPF